jgi:asparaginyl-tRNA synthetase
MQASAIRVIGWVDDPDTYPIQPKPHTLEFLREVASAAADERDRRGDARAAQLGSGDPSVPRRERVFLGEYADHHRVRRGGGGGVVPRVDPGSRQVAAHPAGQGGFRREAFLTVSAQLNVEAYCLALTKVYTFGPTFRAENSNTSRHLAEFSMIEPEIAFADLSEQCGIGGGAAEIHLRGVIERKAGRSRLLRPADREGAGRKTRGDRRRGIRAHGLRRGDPSARAGEREIRVPIKWGIDLQSEHERYLTEKYAKRPVIVMNYPKDIEAFYMRVNDDGRTVAAMDVLAPGIGEIIGGSQREERLEVLDERMAERGIDREHYGWYRDLRRHGTVPHAGFGLGFERGLACVTGLANVRDAIPFPRTPGNARY